ncbi:MAG: NADH-quinone oxidoreductase subunit H [Armatimonadetes bacterium]|nr:MAG: NADH-quinone oxidoreductase subunit H [Armatimonadota bacterium]
MNFWLELIIKLVAILGFVLTGALVVIYAELKAGSHMQGRIGPYYAGGRWGWAQPLADGLKFLQKEDLSPIGADRTVYGFAPYVVMMSTLAVFVVIPFGPDMVGRDLDLGIYFILAISSLSVLGILMAGWSSANKYSLMGGLRAAAQLIAYELPLVLAAAAVVVQAGTMSMNGIVAAQSETWFTVAGIDIAMPFLLKGQIISFIIFMIAVVAELSRIPFDMPIAESELTMGYLTEYSGIRFTMFFLGEYASMIAFSAIAATLFLGGYAAPGVPDNLANLVGPGVMLLKIALIVFVIIWIRWTWPRLREDQLQRLAWFWLIPIALANIGVIAIFKVVF